MKKKNSEKIDPENQTRNADYKHLEQQFTLKMFENIFVVVLATILFTITGIWQLVVLAGFLGGFFTIKSKNAFVIGFIGAFLGWMGLFVYYALTTDLLTFFDFWLEQTMGIPLNFVYLIMFFSSIMGGVIGALGALNGLFISRILFKKISKIRSFF